MKASVLRIWATLACCITAIGLMVMIVDDYDPDYSFYSSQLSAPVNSPSMDWIVQGGSDSTSSNTGLTASALPEYKAIECMPSGPQKCVN